MNSGPYKCFRSAICSMRQVALSFEDCEGTPRALDRAKFREIPTASCPSWVLAPPTVLPFSRAGHFRHDIAAPGAERTARLVSVAARRIGPGQGGRPPAEEGTPHAHRRLPSPSRVRELATPSEGFNNQTPTTCPHCDATGARPRQLNAD
jgi:hypothetical protein